MFSDPVSAVLACYSVSPPYVTQAPIRMYHHTAPKLPLDGPLARLPYAKRVGNMLEYFPGETEPSAKLFGLDEAWPYEHGTPPVAWREIPAPPSKRAR